MKIYDVNIHDFCGTLPSGQSVVAAENPVEAAREVLSKISNQATPDQIDPKAGFELRCFYRSGPVVMSFIPERGPISAIKTEERPAAEPEPPEPVSKKTVNAQQMRAGFLAIAKKIGDRKRISVSKLFELLLEVQNIR